MMGRRLVRRRPARAAALAISAAGARAARCVSICRRALCTTFVSLVGNPPYHRDTPHSALACRINSSCSGGGRGRRLVVARETRTPQSGDVCPPRLPNVVRGAGRASAGGGGGGAWRRRGAEGAQEGAAARGLEAHAHGVEAGGLLVASLVCPLCVGDAWHPLSAGAAARGQRPERRRCPPPPPRRCARGRGGGAAASKHGFAI